MNKVQIIITDKKEEPLLSRTAVKATLEFEKATPSYQEVSPLLASQLKADEKLLAIKHIYNHFGSKRADIIAYIYNDETKKQLIEPKIKQKKEKKAKEVKK